MTAACPPGVNIAICPAGVALAEKPVWVLYSARVVPAAEICEDQKESYVRPCVDVAAVVVDDDIDDEAIAGGGCAAEVAGTIGGVGGGANVELVENSGSVVEGIENCIEDGGCGDSALEAGAGNDAAGNICSWGVVDGVMANCD